MKRLIALLVLTLLCVAPLTFTGCNTTPQRVTYNTLATFAKATEGSYTGYLQSVLSGYTPTNNVPAVTAKYREVRALYEAAVSAATVSTNFATVPPALQTAGAQLTTLISAK